MATEDCAAKLTLGMGRWLPATTWQNPFSRSPYKRLLASVALSGGQERCHWELPCIGWYEPWNFHFLNQFKPLAYNADLWLDHKFLILTASRSTSASTLNLVNLCHDRQNIPSFSHLQQPLPFQKNPKVFPGHFKYSASKVTQDSESPVFPHDFLIIYLILQCSETICPLLSNHSLLPISAPLGGESTESPRSFSGTACQAQLRDAGAGIVRAVFSWIA